MLSFLRLPHTPPPRERLQTRHIDCRGRKPHTISLGRSLPEAPGEKPVPALPSPQGHLCSPRAWAHGPPSILKAGRAAVSAILPKSRPRPAEGQEGSELVRTPGTGLGPRGRLGLSLCHIRSHRQGSRAEHLDFLGSRHSASRQWALHRVEYDAQRPAATAHASAGYPLRSGRSGKGVGPSSPGPPSWQAGGRGLQLNEHPRSSAPQTFARSHGAAGSEEPPSLRPAHSRGSAVSPNWR